MAYGNPKKKASSGKVGKVMHEFKHGTLRSGSKKGPKVKSRKQAIAIGMSEKRREAAGSRKKAAPKDPTPDPISEQEFGVR